MNYICLLINYDSSEFSNYYTGERLVLSYSEIKNVRCEYLDGELCTYITTNTEILSFYDEASIFYIMYTEWKEKNVNMNEKVDININEEKSQYYQVHKIPMVLLENAPAPILFDNFAIRAQDVYNEDNLHVPQPW
jgi:hypothetical protein